MTVPPNFNGFGTFIRALLYDVVIGVLLSQLPSVRFNHFNNIGKCAAVDKELTKLWVGRMTVFDDYLLASLHMTVIVESIVNQVISYLIKAITILQNMAQVFNTI